MPLLLTYTCGNLTNSAGPTLQVDNTSKDGPSLQSFCGRLSPRDELCTSDIQTADCTVRLVLEVRFHKIHTCRQLTTRRLKSSTPSRAILHSLRGGGGTTDANPLGDKRHPPPLGAPFMDNHRPNVGNRVLPFANSCCLCFCKFFATVVTVTGLVALAAGIALFIIFRNSEADFILDDDEDIRTTLPMFSIATLLTVAGSVVFVISLCMWCCVCCMTPKSQPGVVLSQPTSGQTFVTVQQPVSGMTYTPAVMQPPSAPPLPMPAAQPPQYTAPPPPPYSEKSM
ncbi:hypothetical protein SprV_0902749700 [Sparganum proliferum]